MSDPYTLAFEKPEDAFESVLNKYKRDELTGVTIIKGDEFAELVTPRLQILTDESIPEIEGDTVTGNFTNKMLFRIVGHQGDTNRDEFNRWCGAVGDILFRDDVVQILNDAIEVKEFAARQWFPGQARRFTQGSELIRDIEGILYFRPSTPL